MRLNHILLQPLLALLQDISRKDIIILLSKIAITS